MTDLFRKLRGKDGVQEKHLMSLIQGPDAEAWADIRIGWENHSNDTGMMNSLFDLIVCNSCMQKPTSNVSDLNH